MDTTAKSPLLVAAIALVADQILEKFYVGLNPFIHGLLLNGGGCLMGVVLLGEIFECARHVVHRLERCALDAITAWYRVRRAYLKGT